MAMVENDDKYFPSGRMRILAVDDNSTCLEDLLSKCQYNVTSIKDATTALQILRENNKEFDLVISEVHLPDMDAFKLLEEVSTLQIDIPVVLMSSDDDKERVMKGVCYGACDYLVKPVRIEEVKNIWQHVVRRKINNNSSNSNKCDDQSSGTGSSSGVCKKQKDEEKQDCADDHQHELGQRNVVVDEEEEEEEKVTMTPKQKRPRVIWTSELHRKFVAAVEQVGVDKAVPKRILELMDVEGITRENVASHLQKFRMNLKKKSNKKANPQQANNAMVSSFDSAAYYGQVDNSRQCVSYPPASCHQWVHSDNNNNVVQFPTNNMIVHHTIHNQSHEQAMPMTTFVADDFSINCDFANNNNNLMVEDQAGRSKFTNMDTYYRAHNHDSHSWPPTRVCYGQQGPTNFYLPTTTSAPHMLLPITHDMNFGSTPSPSASVLRQEFPRTPSCLHVESRYDGDDYDHMNGGVGGFVSFQPDEDRPREQGSGEHQQQRGVSSPDEP